MVVEFLNEQLKEYSGRHYWFNEEEVRFDFKYSGLSNSEWYCIDYNNFMEPHVKLRYINYPPINGIRSGWRAWTIKGPEDFKEFRNCAENRMAKFYAKKEVKS